MIMKARKESFDEICSHVQTPVSLQNNKSERVRQESGVDEFGRAVNIPGIKVIDREEEMKGYKVVDFSLENLIASGTLASLVAAQPIQNNLMDSADIVEAGLSVLE